MTTITAATSVLDQSVKGTRKRLSGFTLMELMIASGISLIILAAVFSAFIFMARGSFRMGQYADMESNARRALGYFSQDARQAEGAAWTDLNTLQLTVKGKTVVYAYNSSTGTFSRRENAGTPRVLASNIDAFSFSAYQMTGTEISLSASLAAANTAVKMVQINFNLRETNRSTGIATSQVISSRCVLRNKKIT
jgi:prepilin-type N-terminal cleavage/methylation domain-containing protein